MPTEILPYPEVNAKQGDAKYLVVLLHGVGSDGHDLISLVPFLQNDLPNCHFISPHGIEEFDMAPFGRQWFSLLDRNPKTLQKLLSQNAPIIENIIQAKQQELQLDNSKTIVIGFSQGSMSGLYLALSNVNPFLCVVAFSGRLVEPKKLMSNATPTCIIHGEEDEIVTIDAMDSILDYLSENNIEHDSLKIPNLTHSIDSQGLKYAINFINKQIK
ncbi:MAG: dienelactone hydrolase family protein [Rickettsiaceae bacterium]